MASRCNCCESFQDKVPSGTAAPRPSYNQTTCYHHMDEFVNFRNSEEMQNKIRQQSIKLINQNGNLSNIEAGDIVDIFTTYNSNQLILLKKKIQSGEIKLDGVELKNVEKPDIFEIKNKLSEISMLRSPLICPVKGCGQTFGTTSFLAHFIRDHRKKFNALNYQEILRGESVNMEISEKLLAFCENICLGAVLYGGEKNEKKPGQSGLSKPSSLLPQKYLKFTYHLPIIIMVVKTFMNLLAGDEEDVAKKTNDPKDTSEHIMVFWGITGDTTKQLYLTLTVYDTDGMVSKSQIIKIRNFKDNQDPVYFLSRETNYLLLTRGEINQLTRNGSKTMLFDVSVNEEF